VGGFTDVAPTDLALEVDLFFSQNKAESKHRRNALQKSRGALASGTLPAAMNDKLLATIQIVSFVKVLSIRGHMPYCAMRMDSYHYIVLFYTAFWWLFKRNSSSRLRVEKRSEPIP